jgi:hypothetical protein
MKFATVTKLAVLALALILASSAFAATKANLHVNNTLTVNGTNLKPGDYKLQWDGTGPDVEVSILQGKNVVAKVPAKVVDLSAAPQSDATVTRHNNDGSSSLAGVRFEGKKFAIEVPDANDGMQAGSSK